MRAQYVLLHSIWHTRVRYFLRNYFWNKLFNQNSINTIKYTVNYKILIHSWYTKNCKYESQVIVPVSDNLHKLCISKLVISLHKLCISKLVISLHKLCMSQLVISVHKLCMSQLVINIHKLCMSQLVLSVHVMYVPVSDKRA